MLRCLTSFLTSKKDKKQEGDARASGLLQKIRRTSTSKSTSRHATTPSTAPPDMSNTQYVASSGSATEVSGALKTAVDAYESARARLQQDEAALSFEAGVRARATAAERILDEVLLAIKERDATEVYGRAAKTVGYGGQEHARFAGDHFLTSVDLIRQTVLFDVVRQMPKGAHLHIHFNACLAPSVLLGIAAGMEHMYISSNVRLVAGDPATFFRAEMQFAILAASKVKPGNVFAADYKADARQHMRFRDFLSAFPEATVGQTAMAWLESKLAFQPEEAYDAAQTTGGAWARFNGRTRMMKGLFNYETAYRTYTQLFLQDLVDDGIQYAEIRPNFMVTNQVWNDAGTAQMDNAGIVALIVGEVEAFKAAHPRFGGVKIIYCTPRSFARDKVRCSLVECLQFKQRWPAHIAGFDLVGEEAQGQPLHAFAPELLEFQAECARLGLDVPFLFHCGETLDKGTAVDGNLYDALLLQSKRIGHGFALPTHPLVMQRMRERNVCVEVCPISNEVLGLTPRIAGHALYALLANNVPCTVASDNGTLFQSTLSHDVYQVLVGRADLSLFGLRRLAEWSLEHACLSDAERAAAHAHWLAAWQAFVVAQLQTHAGHRPDAQRVLAAIAAGTDVAAHAI